MIEKKTYKNWKEICAVMDWKTIGGTYKQARIKDLDTLCRYHKSGHLFVIDEVYENKLERIKSRKQYEGLNITRDEYENNGVYKITLGNNIYIGSTIAGFRKRFLIHYHGNDEIMEHTYKLIKDGGVFEILEDMTGCDEKTIREREIEYIKQYSNDDKWIVINRKKYKIKDTKKNRRKTKKYKKDLFNGTYKDKVIQAKFNDLIEQEKEKQVNNDYFNYIDFKQYVFDTYEFKELL